MSLTEERIARLAGADSTRRLAALYGEEQAERQKERYAELLRRHCELFGDREKVELVSAPGRAEIGGNHTDHNNGRVLAAAVDMDALCAVSPRDDGKVVFHSEGYPVTEISLDDLSPRKDEEGTTAALIRGVASGMKDAGYAVGGFDAAVTSTVAGGSGLSSSAALEVMLTGAFDALYNRFEMPYVLRAQISRKAENVFFGKPSGLLDQMASAAGGLVTVDFRDNDAPEVKALGYDFAARGYDIAVVATGGSHADLTDHYAAIPAEMKAVAGFFGRRVLRGVTEDEILENAGALRAKFSDRAVMRALHFIREDLRVPLEVRALEEDRLEDFLGLINDSGRSSFMYLQNVFADNRDQSLSLALCMAQGMLEGRGAWRIHGGGFAGTTLNFVPADMRNRFVAVMDGAFGKGAARIIRIRPEGAVWFRL